MRLIDADALCAELQKEFGSPEGHGKLMRINYIITHAPTIDAAPVRHGGWIPLGYRSGFLKNPDSEDFRCSICGYEAYTLFFPPPERCPSCGAKMDGEG